jgi:hypothetical protein
MEDCRRSQRFPNEALQTQEALDDFDIMPPGSKVEGEVSM